MFEFTKKIENYNEGRKITIFNFIFVLISCLNYTHYCAGDKIEKNEMGGACSAYGGGERRVQGFGGKT
jgi:hypothetical protein